MLAGEATRVFERRIDDEVSLALLEEQHAPELFALVEANRKYLRRWLPWLDGNLSVADSAAFIRSSLRSFADRESLACGIRVGGALAGMSGLHRIDWPNRRTGIGYWIAEPHEGKGIVTRAVGGLLHYAFRELELNHVEITCAPGNIRSCAIAERLGFSRVGVVPQREWLYDRFVDMVIYGLTAADWAAPTPSRAAGRRSRSGRRPSARG